MMWLMTLIVMQIKVILASSDLNDLWKCCDSNSSMVMSNDYYYCDKIVTIRLGVMKVLSLGNNDGEECVEAHENSVYIFNSKNETFTKVREVIDEIPHKCCPYAFVYNAQKHSCDEASQASKDKQGIITVGLRHCQIIIDHVYDFFNFTEPKFNKTHIFIEDRNIPKFKDRYCIENTSTGGMVVRICEDMKVCEHARCLNKCCPDGQSFVNGSFCTDTFVHGFDIGNLTYIENNNDSDFAIIHRTKKATGYIMNKGYKYIDKTGKYFEKTRNVSLPQQSYCIEHANKNNISHGYALFRVYNGKLKRPLSKRFIYYRVAMIISEVFLLATILVYICTHETRSLFGKALVSFCTVLFIFFAHLIYLIYHPDLKKKPTNRICRALAFSHLYFGFTAFVWLQILCFDIYWTFGSTNRYQGVLDKKRRDLKRFVFYNIYGWGLPLIITGITVVLHFVDILPDRLKIKIGETKCAIENHSGNYAEILFKLVPLAIMEMTNLIYFLKTIIYICKVKGEIHKMNNNLRNTKKKKRFFAKQERFKLVAKLFITMGISYIFEVVSSIYDFEQTITAFYIEIIWDVINCLQGLFIFIIFVCKMKNYQRCRDYFAVGKMRKISLSSTTRTTVIGLSSVIRKKRTSRDESKK